MFYNIVRGIAPHYLQELLLPFYRPTQIYNLRNADNLTLLYRKQEQFLTTIVFYHQLSVMEWTTIGNKMY